MASKSFGSQHTDQSPPLARTVETKIDELRKDIDSAFITAEERAGFARIESVTVTDPDDNHSATEAVAGALPCLQSAKNTIRIKGSGFDGQGRADLVLDSGVDANSDIEFIALGAGADGNKISVTVVDSDAGGLACTETDDAIQIDLGGAASTAAQVVTALRLVVTVDKLVYCKALGNGGGNVDVQAKQYLSGGAGPSKWTFELNGWPATHKGSLYAATSKEPGHSYLQAEITIANAHEGKLHIIELITGGIAFHGCSLGCKAS